MKTLGRIIGTGIVATEGNFATGYIASKDMKDVVDQLFDGKEIYDNEIISNISIPTAAGFLLSTAPAIVMTAATNIASLSGGKSTVVGAIATFFGYDYYLNFACPKKDLFDKGKDLLKSAGNVVKAGLKEGGEGMAVQFEMEALKHEMSSYMQKVNSSDEMKLAYKLNTIGQNFLFNYIWDSSDDSAPELENGKPEEISS